MNKMLSYTQTVIVISFTLFYTFVAASTVSAELIQIPEPDPPFISFGDLEQPVSVMKSVKAAPSAEWTYHKSADSLHPDDNEQQLLWLMNRARSNPTQEGLWLAATGIAEIESAISYFSVDLDVLKTEFADIAATPPAAFDVRLYNAAKTHSDDLIARDAQDHNNQFTRVTNAGFSYQAARGNVYSYTQSPVHGHAGFNIDWGGNDDTGMQAGRGHRQAIMSMDNHYSNTGIAVVSETDINTDVGPLVTTGNFAIANDSAADHYNRFLVGTVWTDLNDNDMYDTGEGLANITVTPDEGSYYAVTANSGGYAIPVNAGTIVVTFSGSGLSEDITRSVTLSSESVLLDLIYTGSGDNTPEVITETADSITQATATLSGTVNANGQDCSYYFEYGQTTAYGEMTTTYQTSANGQVSVAISGLTTDQGYHYRLVATSSGGTGYGDDVSFNTQSASADSDSDSDSSGGGGGGCFIVTACY